MESKQCEPEKIVGLLEVTGKKMENTGALEPIGKGGIIFGRENPEPRGDRAGPIPRPAVRSYISRSERQRQNQENTT